jgi:four helix bundle protein
MLLEDLKVYRMSMELGEEIWQIVSGWNYFEKDTIGKQIIRAIDSVAANISEGFGRYHFKDSKNFYFYARGSLFETKTWLQKSFTRKLITEDTFVRLNQKVDYTRAILNNFIKSIKNH